MLALRLAAPCLAAIAATATAEPNLEGMWSDPPDTVADTACMFVCTDTLLERLDALLDDPANDDKPLLALFFDAQAHERATYITPRLTAAGLAAVNLEPADDPSFVRCEPPGVARQIFVPHQLEIVRRNDRIELHYGEWDARRTVYLGTAERAPGQPPTRMGFSVGHFAGDALIVETTDIAPDIGPWLGRHSEQLRIVERYARSVDGSRLSLTATLEDPWALREPLVFRKVWGWAPEQEIFAYEDCERPTEVTRGAPAL